MNFSNDILKIAGAVVIFILFMVVVIIIKVLIFKYIVLPILLS